MNVPVRSSLRKGDLVKRKQSGGHVMTVRSIDTVNRKIRTGYKTPDGIEHEEEWSAADLKRVNL